METIANLSDSILYTIYSKLLKWFLSEVANSHRIISPFFSPNKSFIVENITTSKDLEIIVTTIANFSKEFGVKTVAEYVSTKEIYEKIKELNIDYCQGYYFDKPKDYIDIK